MGRDRAAYMREYRSRKKAAHAQYDEAKPLIGALKTRIAELEAEVARLKADRPAVAMTGVRLAMESVAARDAHFNSRPFRPVPKPSKRGK